MLIPHRCPRCESDVETDPVDIDGIESQRIVCSSCETTLVVKPCPECSGESSGGTGDEAPACGVCDGNEVVLEPLEDLLS